MEKDFIDILSEDYEVSKKTIANMAKMIMVSEGVNEDNFITILETAVSNYSSSIPLKREVNSTSKRLVTPIQSCQYALNLEIYNNIITDDYTEKTR